jgi:hypothetical protein
MQVSASPVRPSGMSRLLLGTMGRLAPVRTSARASNTSGGGASSTAAAVPGSAHAVQPVQQPSSQPPQQHPNPQGVGLAGETVQPGSARATDGAAAHRDRESLFSLLTSGRSRPGGDGAHSQHQQTGTPRRSSLTAGSIVTTVRERRRRASHTIGMRPGAGAGGAGGRGTLLERLTRAARLMARGDDGALDYGELLRMGITIPDNVGDK